MPRRALASILSVLVLSVVVPALSAQGRTSAYHLRPATYDVIQKQDVMIKMSDGVKLAADVYLPGKDGKPAAGRFPVALTQTPYNKNGLNFAAPWLVERGYVQVIAEVRGTGSSSGQWDSFGEREQKDSGELVNWAASQPWSDGRIALHGTSYGAINQFFTAARDPGHHVKAMFPIVPMADAYRDITGSGGQINTSFIPLWLGLVTGLGVLPATYTGSDPGTAAGVYADHAQGAVNFQVSSVATATAGEGNAYDNPFYRTRSPIEVVDRVRVPTFIAGGWFDLFQRGEPMLFQHLQRNGVPVKLVMGPWYHVTAGEGLPADGVPSLQELEIRWFDHYVLGKADPGLDAMAPITYYRLGAGHYETAPSWPPPDVHFRQMYLSGPAQPGSPGGLLAKPPKSQDPDTMLAQSASGVCTRSSVQWTAGEGGAGTPCETDNRMNDQSGLAYDVAAGGLDLAGPIAARLFVSTTASDGFLAVRLEDVAPDGTATQLSAGWQVLSLRALDPAKTVREDGMIVQPYHPFTQKSVLSVVSGKVYEVWVEVFPVAAELAKGHTLRISIQPSDAPHLTAPAPQGANSAGGILQIYHDAKYPSAVVLPEQ